jgi:CHAD domain-containing protein
MAKTPARTESERLVKAPGTVRRSSGPTIAQAASRTLRPLVEDAERSLAKASDGKAGEKRVHKLRSALRKLEALVGALGCGFERELADRMLKAVKRARRSAGDVRDMDVAMGVVRRIGDGAALDGAADAAEEVIALLQVRRDRAMKRLGARSKKCKGELRAMLEQVLGAPAERRAELPSRCGAVIALAREATAMRDAVAAGLGTPELLHELRLNLKESRTILEAMGRALGGGVDPLVERARALSDTFGEVNDLATLGELLRAMEGKAGKKRIESLRLVGERVRAAHARGHAASVRLARLEVPRLVAGIFEAAYGEGSRTVPISASSPSTPPRGRRRNVGVSETVRA